MLRATLYTIVTVYESLSTKKQKTYPLFNILISCGGIRVGTPGFQSFGDSIHLFLPAAEPSGLWLVPGKLEAMEWNSGGMGWTKLIVGMGFGRVDEVECNYLTSD